MYCVYYGYYEVRRGGGGGLAPVCMDGGCRPGSSAKRTERALTVCQQVSTRYRPGSIRQFGSLDGLHDRIKNIASEIVFLGHAFVERAVCVNVH